MDQPSLFEARAARDVGIAKTTKKNSEWMQRALDMLPKLRGLGIAEFTGEMARVKLRQIGLEDPTNAHAWGTMIRAAMKRGVVADTGKVVQMFGERSHARRTPVWRLV